MANRDSLIIQEHDVYLLSDKGDEELRGSETSLSPAEIELLVRVDGNLTVGEIAASCRLLKPGSAADAFRSLLGRNLVRLRPKGKVTSREFGTGLAILFDDTPSIQPTRKALTQARAEATAGASTLQKQGYYVRIARRDADKPKLPHGKTLSVVVVEDEPLLAKFLKQYLSFEGYSARIAANREEIIGEFRRPPLPDLVLLDVMLPDADGFEILLKMRQHPVLRTVPVIMLTAKATRDAVLKGLAGGADGYITKPFEPDALIKAIKAVMGLPKNPPKKNGA